VVEKPEALVAPGESAQAMKRPTPEQIVHQQMQAHNIKVQTQENGIWVRGRGWT
jgi:hypothetical protein